MAKRQGARNSRKAIPLKLRHRIVVWIEINSPDRTVDELRTVIRMRPLSHSYSVGDLRPPRRDRNKLTACRLAEAKSAKGDVAGCIESSLARAKLALWRNRLRDNETVRVVMGVFFRTAHLAVTFSPGTVGQLAHNNIGIEIATYPVAD